MTSSNQEVREKSMEVNAGELNPYTSSVNNLSNGVLSLYNTPLTNVKKHLEELTSKQEFLLSQIHSENLRLSEVQYSPEIQETFIRLKINHNKLLNIKKDMKLIYERSTKLKKRALRLQQIKEKSELNKLNNEATLKIPENLFESKSRRDK